MGTFHIVIVAILVIAGATTINGGLFDFLTPKKPAVVVDTVPVAQVKGRLLTPKEGCGYSKVSNTRIIGGSEAKIGAWPWIALLGYRASADGFKFGCGGTLITSRHVLSAAHCMSPLLLIVRLGEHNTTITTDGEHQDIPVAHHESHGSFSWKFKNYDIAVVYLARDVIFNDRIRPICLPISGPILNRRFVDSNPFLAGWGTVDLINKEMSQALMQIQVPVISNEKCKKYYAKLAGYEVDPSSFEDRVVCAGFEKGGKDSCQGDSGGPLMLPVAEDGLFPFYLIGIVSHAQGCGQPKVPGINSNVQFYADWIKEKLALNIDNIKKQE